MLKNLGKKIINNFGLKILAILFAIVLWIVVINIDDPTVTQTYTTSVTLENTNYLTSNDKYYEVLDGTNTVTFRVLAKRSVHDELSNSNFSATANLEKIEYDEKTATYRVPVTITAQKYSNKLEISSKQLYIELALEDLSRTQKVVTATTKGTVKDGCALGAVEITSYNILKISGPTSIVSQIDTVTATINVDGVDTDVTDSVVPVLYDAEGNVIDTTKLTMSLNTVTIKAQILKTKDVPIEFETMGSVADGYMVTDISYKPENVRIKGEAAILNTVNKITVPQEVLDLTGMTSTFDKEVDITAYLDLGTSLVLSSDAKITVTVTIEPVLTKEFEVPVRNISTENLPENSRFTFGEDFVKVEVSGPEDEVKKLNASQLMGVADLSGLGEGEHNVAIEWNLDENVFIVKDVKIPVTIERVNTGTGSTGDTAGDGDTTGSDDTTGTENGTGTGSTDGDNGTGSSGDTAESGAADDDDDTVEDGSTGENGGTDEDGSGTGGTSSGEKPGTGSDSGASGRT